MSKPVNLFSHRKQPEDHFTNGLAALLRLSTFSSGSKMVELFFVSELEFPFANDLQPECFRVLKYEKTETQRETHDAEFCGKNCRIQFENKIASGALRLDQVESHLSKLKPHTEKNKRLVLLTPDDSKSAYVEQFISIDPATIVHLEWRKVYDFLNKSKANCSDSVFSELVGEFLAHIHERIFEQDFAGVIAKVQFGEKSQVYHDKYLKQMEDGTWNKWNTPGQIKNLDGTGRRLMLYDKQRGGITVEVEIAKVRKTHSEPDYPWTNFFAGKPHVFREPIPLDRITSLGDRFKSFGTNRSAYQNVTQEEYRRLKQGLCGE
jgi:hypothetical protein